MSRRRADAAPPPPIRAGDAALIDRFLEMQSVERGAAANSIAAYRTDLEQAARWLGEPGLEHATRDDFGVVVRGWAALRRPSLKPILCSPLIDTC